MAEVATDLELPELAEQDFERLRELFDRMILVLKAYPLFIRCLDEFDMILSAADNTAMLLLLEQETELSEAVRSRATNALGILVEIDDLIKTFRQGLHRLIEGAGVA